MRVYAECAASNAPGIEPFKRLGFQREGALRLGLLAEEREAAKT